MRGWDLEGRRALVTGGTRGIGLATVHELLELGAEVAVVARRVTGLPAGVTAVEGDITSGVDRGAIAAHLGSTWGALDILVNNAGMNIRRSWVDMTDADRHAVIATDLTGPSELLRLMHSLLKKGRSASVVNVASVAGLVDVGSGAAYAMSKAGLIGLTRSLAVEWAADHIRVNAVAPWYVRTPLTEPVLNDPARLRRILERTPQRRVGSPEEIAAVIAFLAMPKSAFLTGQCIAVDGGFLASGM